MNQQSNTRYDTLSLALHWVTAALVVVAFVLGPERFGRLMRQGVDPATRLDIVWHESLGILVLVLTLLRLAWAALRSDTPQFEATGMMQLTARLVRWMLWILLLTLPVTAFLALGSEGHPLTLLGGLRVDRMAIVADSVVAKWANWGDLHRFLGDAILWLAGLHAAAAFFHHFVLKDGVLAAMLPRWKSQ